MLDIIDVAMLLKKNIVSIKNDTFKDEKYVFFKNKNIAYDFENKIVYTPLEFLLKERNDVTEDVAKHILENFDKNKIRYTIQNKKPYSKNEIEELNNFDLLDILSKYGINVKKDNKVAYKCKINGDNIAIFFKDNNFYNFNTEKSGKAIDLIQIIENCNFLEACNILKLNDFRKVQYVEKEVKIEKPITLPKIKKFSISEYKPLFKYFYQRGIDLNLVKKEIEKGNIFFDVRNNIGFIGRNKNNEIKYVFLNGSDISRRFKQEVDGSSKNYSYVHKSEEEAEVLVAVEGVFDALSFRQLYPNYFKKNYDVISLGGTSSIPIMTYLEENKNIKEVVLALDNDKKGIEGTENIMIILKTRYRNNEITLKTLTCPKKDWNELLLQKENEIINNFKENSYDRC